MDYFCSLSIKHRSDIAMFFFTGHVTCMWGHFGPFPLASELIKSRSKGQSRAQSSPSEERTGLAEVQSGLRLTQIPKGSEM